MKSKIEKLKLKNHDLIVDYDRIEGKVNELIEAHNRYFAPEETETLNITDEKWLEVKEAIENLTKEDLFTWLQDVLVFPEWGEGREEAEDLYTKGHKKWKATIQPATKDIGNMKPYTN